MGTHLTERIVKAAEIGTRKYVVFDEDCAGFGLCVFLSGRKGFVLIYCVAGRQRRMTIGTWPAWSVVAAREEAKRLKRDIDRGEDPMDTRTNARHAATIDELVDRYIDEHLPKLSVSSSKDQASMLKTLVLPEWRSRKVTDITPTDVDRLLTKVAAGRGCVSNVVETLWRR
ncbi:MAG: Arm DNA-binding domain-containing protein, partial [Paracoccaceae bacterium]|nr:Arm DNA-binding domain-containing protein [Paracoccaceae bacterium]